MPTAAYRSSSRPADTPSTSMPAAFCRISRAHQFPGQALAVDSIATPASGPSRSARVMFGGKRARHELVRLAIPRRVYTQSHIDYLVEAILEVNERKDELRGFEIAEEPEFLRHFTARFRPL